MRHNDDMFGLLFRKGLYIVLKINKKRTFDKTVLFILFQSLSNGI